MSKNLILVITLLCSLGLSSCTQLQTHFSLDSQAKEDYLVCSGACIIENSIRKDGVYYEAYQKASDVINGLLKDPLVSREKLKSALVESISKIMSPYITNIVTNKVLDLYDDTLIDLYSNEDLLYALEATKAAIDSGIRLYDNPERPVQVYSGK